MPRRRANIFGVIQIVSAKKFVFGLLVPAFLIGSLLSSSPVWAENVPADPWKPSPWVKTQPYFEQAGHKLGFGVLNVASGWLAIFYEPARPDGFFKGLARGIGYMVIYTAGGAVHAVTFPIPVDLPLPKGGMSFEQ